MTRLSQDDPAGPFKKTGDSDGENIAVKTCFHGDVFAT